MTNPYHVELPRNYYRELPFDVWVKLFQARGSYSRAFNAFHDFYLTKNPQGAILYYQSAMCTINVVDGKFMIYKFFSTTRNRRHGTGLMKIVEKIVHQHKIDIYAQVEPMVCVTDPNALDQEALERFFRKFGFVNYSHDGGLTMKREHSVMPSFPGPSRELLAL